MSETNMRHKVMRVAMFPRPQWTARIGQIGTVVVVSPSITKREWDGLVLRFDDGAEMMFAREDLSEPLD